MSTKEFRKNLLENAKKVKTPSTSSPRVELSAGEVYIQERKKVREPVTEELTLGQRLLQERLEGKPFIETPIITESVETPEVSEDVQETAQMISEISEAMPEQRGRRVTPDTEDGRLLEYIDTIKSTTETSQQKSLIEQDLQNTAATMADLANLRSVVTRLQTSLTSLGGGGIGYQEVRQMIEDGHYNIDSADLWALEASIVQYIDSSLDARFDSAIIGDVYTTDDVTEASNLYYTDARADSAVDAGFAKRTTDDLDEGSNLYYTQSRFDSALAGKTTTDLSEGSNLYYTQARFDSAFANKDLGTAYDSSQVQDQIDSAINAIVPFDISTKTTTDLAEGSNLYYTSARATALINSTVDAAFLNEMIAIDALSDVQINSPSLEANNVLQWNGSVWTNSTLGIATTVEFKGSVDATVDTAPAADNGDLYISISSGTADASWAGLTSVDSGDSLVYDEDDLEWRNLGNFSANSVTSIQPGTGIEVDATDHISPVLSINKTVTDGWYYTQPQVDSDFGVLPSTYLTLAGGTLTGDLILDNSSNITVKGASIRATDGGKLTSNLLSSVGNSNLSIQRNDVTAIQITNGQNRNFQKATYVSDYGITDDLDIPHKKYVDDKFDISSYPELT